HARARGERRQVDVELAGRRVVRDAGAADDGDAGRVQGQAGRRRVEDADVVGGGVGRTAGVAERQDVRGGAAVGAELHELRQVGDRRLDDGEVRPGAGGAVGGAVHEELEVAREHVPGVVTVGGAGAGVVHQGVELDEDVFLVGVVVRDPGDAAGEVH